MIFWSNLGQNQSISKFKKKKKLFVKNWYLNFEQVSWTRMFASFLYRDNSCHKLTNGKFLFNWLECW